MSLAADDLRWMGRALELAEKGRGRVEPNPMVGAVIVKDGQLIGQGFHETHGGPHAEVNAFSNCQTSPEGSTLYVTLEPCCHHGKTPPCTDAVLREKVARVVIGMQDPFPLVAGGGLQILCNAGLDVSTGILQDEAKQLNAPYVKRLTQNKPWIIAKWAMTLDGKLATASGSSKWISSEAARVDVHRIRGMMDAILIGSNTARLDDPLLTVRPQGVRTPARIVFDHQATLPTTSKLVESLEEAPLIVATSTVAKSERLEQLAHSGCDLLFCEGTSHAERMTSLLEQLAARQMTNIMAEGGQSLLGLLLDLRQIDEVFAYVAPKIIGGEGAKTPIGGNGFGEMEQAIPLKRTQVDSFGESIRIHGFTDFATS